MTKGIKYHAFRIAMILFFSWCFLSSIYDNITCGTELTTRKVIGLLVDIILIIGFACEIYSSRYNLKSPIKIYQEKKLSGNLLLNVTIFLLFVGLVLAIIFGVIYKASNNTMGGMTPLEALGIVAAVIIFALIIAYYEGCKVEEKDMSLNKGIEQE